MKKKLLLFFSVLCLAILFVAAGCDGNNTGGTTGGNSGEGGDQTPETFTVTLDFDESVGSIVLTPAAEGNVYEKGAAVTAEVSPLPGRVFESFKADGTEIALKDNKYSFTVEKDVTLSATFSTVPMPASVLTSLKGQTAYTGSGSEKRVYDGYDDYPVNYDYTFEVVFDGDLAFHAKYEKNISLFLTNAVYKNESGKAVSYARTVENKIDIQETGKDYALFGNPFETLTAEDFIATGDNGYTLTDKEKAAKCATVFTGAEEEIESFTVYEMNGKVSFIMIDTPEKAIGDGIAIEHYTYSAHYVFDIAAAYELDSRLSPYPKAAAHDDLKAALDKAAAAKSYRYDVTEDDTYHYAFYVTEKGIYNDEQGAELGFYLHSDGLVHYLEPDGSGKLAIGDVVEGSVDGEHFTTTSDIAVLKPFFNTFSPEIFESKGEGVFELRAEDPELIHIVAQFLWSFGDDLTMNFANGVQLVVEGGVLKEAHITSTVYGFPTTFDIVYSGWDGTTFPLPVEGEEGGTDPNTPVVPPVSSAYPAKFYGKFTGSDWHDTEYEIEITAETIKVTVDGTAATVTGVSYDTAKGKIALTVNGAPCTISVSGNPEVTEASRIMFVSDDFSTYPSTTLSRVVEGEDASTYPPRFYGTFEGTYTNYADNTETIYVVTIAEGSITITIGGVAATVEYVGYDAEMETISIKLNGKSYDIANYSDAGAQVDEINLSGASYTDPMVNLTRKA